jgi:hypothetical protein
MMAGLQQIQRAALNAPPRAVHHPRRQRPGPQQGEVRAHRIGARSPGSPHLRRRHRPPPGQRPGHFILAVISLHNVCEYATYCLAEIFNLLCKLSR